MRLGVAAAVVDGERLPGDVAIRDGRIAGVGLAPAGAGGLAVPGFLDLQVNGFAGVDLLAAAPEDYARIGPALLATGVTAYQPTFITAAPADTDAALAVLAEVAGAAPGPAPRILGAHLEGPFLSPAWPGAHPREHLCEPDRPLVEGWLARGPVAAMTLAPELPGAHELITALVARGITVHVGHTDATAAQAHDAFGAGARALTHVHNAHRRWASRDPGPAGAALVRAGVTVTAIVDGVHLARETARGAQLAAGERFCLVSDAMAAAGLGDGRYRLGDREVDVAGGAARLGDGRLAGSVATMDAALRELVASGASVLEAVHAATQAPARLAARPDLGTLRPGARADVAVLDDRLEVVRTLIAGDERT